MNEEKEYKYRKAYKIAVMAFIFAVLAFTVWASTEPITYTNSTYYNNTTGGGGVSFNGSAVDLNGSSLYNGSVPSDNSKVNKSGDNMTGNLKIINVTVGNLSGAMGFEMQDKNNDTASGFYGTFNAYNDTYGGYMTSNANMYYNPISKHWGKRNNSQYGVINGIAYYYDVAVSVPFWFIAFSAPGGSPDTQTVPVLMSPNDTIFYNNLTINKLSGSENAYVCVDSTGILYRAASC